VNDNGAYALLVGYSSGNYARIRNVKNTPMVFETNNTERMRIDSSGDVGIGTTPSAKLHVNQTATDEPCGYFYQNTSGAQNCLQIINDGAGNSGSALYVRNDGSGNAITVDDGSGGNFVFGVTNLGVCTIGDSTPESGDADNPKNLYLQGADSNMVIKNTAANSSSQRQGICFLNSSGTRVGTIAIRNTGTDYITSSDYRLKENIVELPNGLTRLMALKPVKFDWKLDGETSEGFIAHELHEQFAHAVMGEKDGAAMQAMDYGRITPLLVKAIQEQQTIIEDLKARIETLEG